ncbi:antitoxin Xre/MbcA/ParS toxin-binding domain-containing protein [Parazoarcus communis]
MDCETLPDFSRLSEDERASYIDELAHDVWSDSDAAVQYLTTPSKHFGGVSPVDISRSSDGASKVCIQLFRLYYGIFQ